ncbi:MAG TPA: hypothetical protein VGZ22_24070 [Isosphaeraceae bacterium]|jgi:hypothetical protein|nr:hypothetical protein [Isosphaeraceae bacterium]
MKRPRLSIARLMAVVGVVGLHLAGGRALWAFDPTVLADFALPMLALEVGLLGAMRGPGQARWFWGGAIAGGSLATLSYLVTLGCLTGVVRAMELPRTCALAEHARAEIESLWHQYDVCVCDLINHAPPKVLEVLYRALRENDWIVDATIWFLPELVISLGSGLLGLSLARCLTRCGRRRPGLQDNA